MGRARPALPSLTCLSLVEPFLQLHNTKVHQYPPYRKGQLNLNFLCACSPLKLRPVIFLAAQRRDHAIIPPQLSCFCLNIWMHAWYPQKLGNIGIEVKLGGCEAPYRCWELWSSSRRASALSYWAIYPAPHTASLTRNTDLTEDFYKIEIPLIL